MPLTPEQHDRACENRGRALVLLAQGPHRAALEVAVDKWLREVDGDVERLLADIPSVSTRESVWKVLQNVTKYKPTD